MITPNSHMNPYYGNEEISSVTEYINSGGWIMEHTKTREMEQMICDFTGAKYAHMVPSATAGLLIAAMLAEIKKDELFCSSAYTQAATVNGAILLGGVPVFVDIDPATHTIDFNKIPENCRVVFVTSINGRYPHDIENKIKTLRENGHFVIEDAAQALGSWSTTFRHCGTMGDVGVFSFGAPKIITTGQGGCIITNSKTISDRIHAIKNFGRSVGVTGETYNVMGMNFKFTDLQAAFGVEQMRKLPDIVQKKRDLYNLYTYGLNSLTFSGHVIVPETNNQFTTVTYPDILVRDPNDKYPLMEEFSKFNIGVRSVYQSLSHQPFHSKWSTPTPDTDWIYERGIQLPGQINLEANDIEKIVSIIEDFYAKKNRKKQFSHVYKKLYNTVDKISVVIIGQPRYVGTSEWENYFVKPFRNTIEESPVPMDIFVATNHYDVHDKTTELSDILIPNIDKPHQPLRVIQTEKFENYIREQFNFANDIKFAYTDPYLDLWNHSVDMAENSNRTNENCFSLRYFNPYFHQQAIYYQNKNYFDNLSENSVVVKTRFDVGFLAAGRSNISTLWNIVGPLLTKFTGTDELTIGAESQIYKFENVKLNLSPKVLTFADITRSIINGKIFAPDYTHIFDRDGFILFAKEIINYHIDELNTPLFSLDNASDNKRFTAKPEVFLNDFFLKNNYSFKFSSESPNIWGNPLTLLIRDFLKFAVDDHHIRWYDKL